MTLITIRNLGVTLSTPLFSRLNLVVNPGDRIGLGLGRLHATGDSSTGTRRSDGTALQLG